MAEVLRNWPQRDVRFICLSTGGPILGLGDIGASGMGIPIGKLQLYTACSAAPPNCLLPVLSDIGTTNDTPRADPLYLGLREKPPSEEELDALVEEFVQAVQQVFPGDCIHSKDWKGTDAIRLLARYRDKVLCYDDDTQGSVRGMYISRDIKGSQRRGTPQLAGARRALHLRLHWWAYPKTWQHRFRARTGRHGKEKFLERTGPPVRTLTQRERTCRVGGSDFGKFMLYFVPRTAIVAQYP
jgi:hypothetical protein